MLYWLSTKHNSIDLIKKAFSYKQIEEHKQKRINTQSEIIYVYEMDLSKRFELSIRKD